jgi:hypothetical protein
MAMMDEKSCAPCKGANHIACLGIGKYECDLCIRYDLRGEAIAAERRRLNSSRFCGND